MNMRMMVFKFYLDLELRFTPKAKHMEIVALFCFSIILNSSSEDLTDDSFDVEVTSLNDWLQIDHNFYDVVYRSSFDFYVLSQDCSEQFKRRFEKQQFRSRSKFTKWLIRS